MSTSPTFSDEHLEARARELLLDGTEELAEVGGAVFDVATRRSYWSRKTRELHEVPDDFQPATQRVLDMVAPEARPMVESALLDCVSTG
ncbi:MAG: hypothetical protein SF172_00700, partial [Burkholderiales bacterium]|nr:hypothetical protein [Burkholderiales bacterium]